jgi:hypothetical protein
VKFTDTYPESDEKQENEENFTLDIYVEKEENQNSNRQQENQERAGNQDLEEDLKKILL